ncbi:hypothetical protein Pla123a_10710 [Posidoniimonas polymericola]|uniref:Uncharacterized protein n=1 Tax=Posidoniimonas polymericola TaxID=2528002 RepID=A0A5C5YTZ9_9BACT|nr:hypothetical protein [Posidoniimonas polymericola]TWT78280.1 hypothetical protein Pla123a_10710 [Posidoniimonas polymericola]
MPACAIADDHDALMDLEDRRIDYLPTSSEIAQACQAIRARWSLNEQRRRYVGELAPEGVELTWRPPVIDTSAFQLAVGSGSEHL